MNKITVRQRINPNFVQTFHFSDPPTEVKPHPSCPDHGFNIIDHEIISQQTPQQLQHKKQTKIKKEEVAIVQGSIKSKVLKQKDLQGQLEEMGTGFFLKQSYPSNYNAQKLIPTDCSFNNQHYDKIGYQNEYAAYSKQNFDTTLKEIYDTQPYDYSFGRKIYTFAEPKKKRY